jgi:hypothetical protein
MLTSTPKIPRRAQNTQKGDVLGGAVSIKLTPLMAVEEIDDAATETASYRATGT